jgi:hypothetical protein
MATTRIAFMTLALQLCSKVRAAFAITQKNPAFGIGAMVKPAA